MSEKEKIVSKNFDLSVSFNGYLLAHPNEARKIQNNSVIFFEIKNSNPLNRAVNRLNQRLAKASLDAGEKCYRAVKFNDKWEIERLTEATV